MNKRELQEMKAKIEEAIAMIPVPPPGRNIACAKTKLDEARLWLKEEISKK